MLQTRNFMSTFFIALLLLSSCLFQSGDCSAESSWQTIGPFGGRIMSLAIAATDSKTLYAATWGGGIFRTTNGGASWKAVNNGLPYKSISFVAVDAFDSKIAFTPINGKVYRTADGGDSWTPAASPWGYGSVDSIVLDPLAKNTLYVNGSDYSSKYIYKSTDGGSTWVQIYSGSSSYLSYGTDKIVVDRTDSTGKTFYQAGSTGIAKSTNGGSSWQVRANTGWTFTQVDALAIDHANGNVLYAGSYNGGVLKTTDGGGTWSVKNSGIPIYESGSTQAVSSIAVDPHDSNKVYIGTRDGGVLRSVNGGESWQIVVNPTSEWRNTTQSIVVDPTNSGTVYAGTEYGDVFKSIDAGATWKRANSGIANVGLMALSANPANGKVIYTASDIGYMYRTSDGGKTWSRSSAELPTNARTIAINPANDAVAYAGTYGAGIYKTVDGGVSWSAANTGLSSGSYVSDVVIDGKSPQKLYAAVWSGSSQGVFRSVDGGATWLTAYGGTSAYRIVVDPTDSQTILAATGAGFLKSTNGGIDWTVASAGISFVWCLAVDPNNHQVLYIGSGTEILKSVDGGSTWTHNGYITATYYAQNFMAIAVDPADSSVVYAGSGGGGGNTLFRSNDGGATWTLIGEGLPGTDIRGLMVDPLSRQLTVATYDSGIIRQVKLGAPVISAPAIAYCTIGKPCSIGVSASSWPTPTLSASGDLPNGLAFNPATGTLSGTPLLGSSGTHQVTFIASTGVPPDASCAVNITVLPSSVLTAGITAPSGTAPLAALSAIGGTASGSGLAKVEVQVFDGAFYLQGDGSFSLTPAWLTATGTASWTLNTSTAAWVAGRPYSVTVKVSSSSSQAVSSTTFSIKQSLSKQGVTLAGVFTPDTIKAGESASISGALTKTDMTPVSGKTVTVIVTPPAVPGGTLPVKSVYTFTTGLSGTFDNAPGITCPTPGVYGVEVRFDGSDTLQPSVYNLSLPVVAQSGYAVIVVGKAADNSLLTEHTKTATAIYETLISKRGFSDANIIPLVSSTGAAVTKQQIQDALGQIKTKFLAAPAPVYLVMIDHGSPGGFVLGSEILTPDGTGDAKNLGALLDGFESGIDPAVLTKYPRFVIVGSCYSGQFQRLGNKAGRIVVTSSTASELSIAGAYDLGDLTQLSGGDYFIDSLFGFLRRGDSFKDAFTQASQGVVASDPRNYNGSVPLLLHAEVVDTNAQHPLINDSGDATGSFRLDAGSNGEVAGKLYLGEGVRVPAEGNPADIVKVPATAFLDAGTTAMRLEGWVNDNSRVLNNVWAEIRTPNTSTAPASGGAQGTGQVVPSDMELVQLVFDGEKWVGDYTNFNTAGSYDVYFHSKDSLSSDGGQTYDLSPMAQTRVYKNYALNPAPAPFALVSPGPGATVAPSFALTWDGSSDADGLTYTLQVATDQNFQTVVYREENIPQPAFYLGPNALTSPGSTSGASLCAGGCWWRVQAVDRFGALTTSAPRSFTVVTTNALPGLVFGYVLDAVTAAPISKATVSSGTTTTATLDNGAFLLSLAPGTSYTMSASSNGRTMSKQVTVSAGKVTAVNFDLTAPAIDGACGSSNGQTLSSSPVADLCGDGSLPPVTGTGPWSWTCAGTNGGASASCSASKFLSQTISFAPAASKTYGDQATTLSATASSGLPVTFSLVSGPGSLSGTSNATLAITGAGTVVLRASQAGSGSYAAAPDVQKSIVVGKAALVVTAEDKTRLVSTANPTLSVSYSGFVNGDTASVLAGAAVLSTAATQGSPAGSYPITVAQGTLASSNYSFTLADGTLTVTSGATTYAVTGSVTGSGTIQCVSPVASGNTTTCSLNPSDLSRISSVSGCGSGALNGSTYTTGAVTGDCTVTVTFGAIRAGDCDRSDAVTISEVQTAINMYLGIKNPEVCVDSDRSGGVSISEVQKTINAFLGM